MLLEFGGYTLAPNALECIGEVRKSAEPGDLYELRIRTRSGFEISKRFATKAAAANARDDLLTQLRRAT